jgi:hypothetical protein
MAPVGTSILTIVSSMIWVRSLRPLLAVAFAGIVVARGLIAQTSGSPASPPLGRVQLQAMARAADSAGRKEEAFTLRTRLQNGDFEVGDRITVTYKGLVLKGTEEDTVQAGRILHLQTPLGDMNLTGMLAPELQDSLNARVAMYFKNTPVQATVMLRLAISGAVRSAGFFYVKPDTPLSDLIMKTGGQDPNADLQNVIIRRGTQVLWTNQDVRSALLDGVTVERLNLEPGDEVVVGAKQQNRTLMIVQIGISVLTLAFTFWRLGR